MTARGIRHGPLPDDPSKRVQRTGAAETVAADPFRAPASEQELEVDDVQQVTRHPG